MIDPHGPCHCATDSLKRQPNQRSAGGSGSGPILWASCFSCIHLTCFYAGCRQDSDDYFCQVLQSHWINRSDLRIVHFPLEDSKNFA